MLPKEYRPQQRAALVAWHLAHDEGLRTADVARLTGISWTGAKQLLCILSLSLPIYQDDQHVWQVLVIKEDGES